MRIAALLLTLVTACSTSSSRNEVRLLNVSYDPTRELYAEVNVAFAAQWEQKTGQKVVIEQSHGGSGKQARAVIDGLEADIVTLGLAYDIDAIAKAGLVHRDWATKFPERATPYTSTIVFLVRKGNPKGIHDWNDLAKPGIQVVTPNPKTSGGARWNYLAAYGYGLDHGGSDISARAFVADVFKNVPVLDSGARGATTTFVEHELGDVLVSWENEALLALQKMGPDKVELVVPSMSILAEPPVAIVDEVVDRRGTREVATAYLQFLYSPEGQKLAAKHYYRPRDPAVAPIGRFAKLDTFTIDAKFGGWQQAQAKHFDDNGVFDALIARR